MLTRDQFEVTCHSFTGCHPKWSWIRSDRPGYGFLTRTSHHEWKSPFDPHSYIDLEEVEIEEEDIATAQASELPSLTVHEYIVYSASFNVPAFYFTMQDSSACANLLALQ